MVQLARLLERFPQSWFVNSGDRCLSDKKDREQAMDMIVPEKEYSGLGALQRLGPRSCSFVRRWFAFLRLIDLGLATLRCALGGRGPGKFVAVEQVPLVFCRMLNRVDVIVELDTETGF